MIAVSVTADTSAARRDLSTLNGGIHQAIALALRGAMAAAVESARGTTRFKDRSTETRQSIHGEPLPGLRGEVQAAGAAGFLENGTRAHTIVARQAQALRFVANGQVLYRRLVHHPGTAPRPFMQEARDKAETAAEFAAEYYVGEAIRRV